MSVGTVSEYNYNMGKFESLWCILEVYLCNFSSKQEIDVTGAIACFFQFKYNLGQKYYAPQVRPNREFELMTTRSWQ